MTWMKTFFRGKESAAMNKAKAVLYCIDALHDLDSRYAILDDVMDLRYRGKFNDPMYKKIEELLDRLGKAYDDVEDTLLTYLTCMVIEGENNAEKACASL